MILDVIIFLVLILLFLFLSARIAFWVALGIPAAMLFSIAMMYAFGITLNMISLFGMILVVGILVDDGIVIAENIYSHFERGKTPMKAALDGTMEVELVDYFVSKADEFINPANPEEGTTGKVLFTMSETYPNPEQMGNHMTQAMAWDGINDLMKLFEDYDATVLAGGQVLQTL